MNNVPKAIYLHTGSDCDADDFNDIADFVVWSPDKIDPNDIKYVIEHKKG